MELLLVLLLLPLSLFMPPADFVTVVIDETLGEAAQKLLGIMLRIC